MTRRRQRAAAGEEGFVMIAAILVMVVVLSVTTVVLMDSISARATSFKDYGAKRAQAATDDGVQQEIYRANEMNVSALNFYNGLGGLTSTLACALNITSGTQLFVGGLASGTVGISCPTTGKTLPGGDNVLPPLEDVGNHEAYRSWFFPNATAANTGGRVTLQPVVVAEGHDTKGTATESDDTIRKSMAILKPIDPFRAVEANGSVTFKGVSTTIYGDVAAKKDFTIAGTGAAVLTGLNLSGGLQSSFTYGGSLVKSCALCVTAPSPSSSSSYTGRTAISVAASKPDCGTGTSGVGPCPTGYSATTHQLNVPAATTVTLAAGDYVFCGLNVPATATLTRDTSSAPVRIFIDSPTSTRCAGAAAGAVAKGNLSILGTLNPGVTTDSRRVQIYMAGNGSAGGTTAVISTQSLTTTTASYFFYGPDTDITANFLTYQGSIIGNNVTMNATGGLLGVITEDLGLTQSALATSIGAYKVKQYIECAPQKVQPSLTAVQFKVTSNLC